MMKWFAERRIDAFERTFEYDMSYARQILDASPKALMTFVKATELARCRLDLPLEVWHVARLSAIHVGDCGPCTQLTVQLAEADGISAQVIRAALTQDYAALSPDSSLAARFTRATLLRHEEADELREQVLETLGPSGLVALSLTLAGTSLYPIVKYALGYGHACSTLKVGGQSVRPQPIESPETRSAETLATAITA